MRCVGGGGAWVCSEAIQLYKSLPPALERNKDVRLLVHGIPHTSLIILLFYVMRNVLMCHNLLFLTVLT